MDLIIFFKGRQPSTFIAFCVGSILFVPLWALAGGNPHLSEAITHAQEAVENGDMGYPDDLVIHAEVALEHARKAQSEMSNPHLHEGIQELDKAIVHGKEGHTDVATKHAQNAIMHLREVE